MTGMGILVFCFASRKMWVKSSKCSIPRKLVRNLIVLSLRVLPKNGKEREYEIQQLQERGILAVERLEELNSLADAIYRYLWTCLDQSHIQTSSMSVFGMYLDRPAD